MKIIAAFSVLLFSAAQATCPNGCSGHGTCGVDDICTCYKGWGTGGKGGGDCSDRFCPYELAWVDGPTSTGDKHNYAECANKGICDREKGECTCLDGFEGKGCGRQSCPIDCSGHGTCELMKDLTFGKTYNEYHDGTSIARSGLGTGAKVLSDYSWDADRARICVCDPGFTGLKCDLRMCPRGKDVMDVILSGEQPQIQTITLFDHNDLNSNFGGQTFALQFTTQRNQTFATQPIAWASPDSTLQLYIKNALLRLPNNAIDDVEVSVDSTNNLNGVVIDITFTGPAVMGPQHKIEVLADECSDGCTPLITGLANLRSYHATTLSGVEVSSQGSHNAHECGRRGKCDYTTGICDCYDGYAGDACDIFNEIV